MLPLDWSQLMHFGQEYQRRCVVFFSLDPIRGNTVWTGDVTWDIPSIQHGAYPIAGSLCIFAS